MTPEDPHVGGGGAQNFSSKILGTTLMSMAPHKWPTWTQDDPRYPQNASRDGPKMTQDDPHWGRGVPRFFLLKFWAPLRSPSRITSGPHGLKMTPESKFLDWSAQWVGVSLTQSIGCIMHHTYSCIQFEIGKFSRPPKLPAVQLPSVGWLKHP